MVSSLSPVVGHSSRPKPADQQEEKIFNFSTPPETSSWCGPISSVQRPTLPSSSWCQDQDFDSKCAPQANRRRTVPAASSLAQHGWCPIVFLVEIYYHFSPFSRRPAVLPRVYAVSLPRGGTRIFLRWKLWAPPPAWYFRFCTLSILILPGDC